MQETIDINTMKDKADVVSSFLKGIASPQRLMILCLLLEGEKSVSELIEATGIPQTSMSQHLAKLKQENIVSYRRDHRTLYYSITADQVYKIMQILHETYCQEDKKK